MPDSRNIHFLSGSVVVLPLVWEFELAVSSSVLKPANESDGDHWRRRRLGRGISRFYYWQTIGGRRVERSTVSVLVVEPGFEAGASKVHRRRFYPSARFMLLGLIFSPRWNAYSSIMMSMYLIASTYFSASLAYLLLRVSRSAENNLACHLEEMKTAKDLQHSHWDPYIEEHVFKRLLAGTKCDTEQ